MLQSGHRATPITSHVKLVPAIVINIDIAHASLVTLNRADRFWDAVSTLDGRSKRRVAQLDNLKTSLLRNIPLGEGADVTDLCLRIAQLA